ncbi:MAG: internal scaffolding protein [Arizlama microvirus]|nr:MAG: internal scaffolding protein [Arizlama microvirus]
MKSRYKENKAAARIYTKGETLTDQSAARETDINVIVRKFTQTGMVPAAKNAPMSGDFTEFPTSLREFIETARQGNPLREKLPEQLKNMKTEELLALNAQQLTDILAPKPADPPVSQEKKE